MTTLSLAQLGALLALIWAGLLWLYLRRPRALQKRVPFLALWDALPGAGLARRRFRVERTWALLRALLASAALAFALHDPQPGAPQRTLLVLDAGAHMLARDVAPNRFEAARRAAGELVRARVGRGELRIAQLASELTPLTGWTRDVAQLNAALERARASYAATRFPAALEATRGTEVILISDGAFQLPETARAQLAAAGVELRQLRVGESSHNVGIRAFAARADAWDAARAELLVEVENADGQPHELELRLFEAGRAIDVRPLRLAASTRRREIFTLGASEDRLAVRLSAADAQPLDDLAYAVLSQPKPRRVLLVSAGNRYLERALELDPRLQLERVSPEAYASATGYDAVIFDRFAPASLPEAPSLWIAPDGGPYRVLGSLERPFFDELESDEPLLRWIALRDVNIRRAQRVSLEPRDHVLARSRLGPLLVSGEREGRAFLAFTFDVRESDLVLRAAWPILLHRAIERLTGARSELETSLWLGASQPRALPPSATNARLIAPSGATRELEPRAGQVWIEPAEPGFQRLIAGDSERLLAANPDPAAALHIAPRQLVPPPEAATTRTLAASAPLWWLLLVAALLVLALDTWALRKEPQP
ncbi:MAG TPA: VWA domain-containing protein [Polyangiales bacterium]|nr:VWA domain-containing protein [Polyangiales bacterium]